MAKDVQQGQGALPVTFIDIAFRSRVVVFPDGSHIAVLAGKATVTEPAHIKYLGAHVDFRRVDAQVP